MEVLQATRGFNTKMAYIILDDLGYPYFRNIYIYIYELCMNIREHTPKQVFPYGK